MSGLPIALRRSPTYLYAAAAVLFVWYVGNSYVELVAMPQMPNELEGLTALMKSKVLYEAAREAVYVASTGAMLHVLIFIYDKVRGGRGMKTSLKPNNSVTLNLFQGPFLRTNRRADRQQDRVVCSLSAPTALPARWTLKQVQGDELGMGSAVA